MPAGRPSKYNEGILELSNEYLDNYQEHGDAIPSVVGLACALDVGRRTLYAWAEAHEEFQHILEKINTRQEKVLVTNGLNGEFNSNITKLVLGKHGYHESKDITSGGKPLQNEWHLHPVTTDNGKD